MTIVHNYMGRKLHLLSLLVSLHIASFTRFKIWCWSLPHGGIRHCKSDPEHEKWEYLKTMTEREGIERIYLSCSSFSVWSLSSNWALRLLLAAVCLLISLLALCGEKESHIYPIIWYPIVHDSFMSIEPSGCLMRMLFHICFTEIYTSTCTVY